MLHIVPLFGYSDAVDRLMMNLKAYRCPTTIIRTLNNSQIYEEKISLKYDLYYSSLYRNIITVVFESNAVKYLCFGKHSLAILAVHHSNLPSDFILHLSQQKRVSMRHHCTLLQPYMEQTQCTVTTTCLNSKYL